MKTTDLIADALMELHKGNNWTSVSIAETVADISWKGAIAQVLFTPNTIAEILYHITYWNRIVAERGRGIVPEVNESNGFDVPLITDKEGWTRLKEDNLRSAEELAEVIRGYEDSKLMDPILPEHASAYKNFQGQVEHGYYHLGQIVMLKKYIKSQP